MKQKLLGLITKIKTLVQLFIVIYLLTLTFPCSAKTNALEPRRICQTEVHLFRKSSLYLFFFKRYP